MKRDYFVYNGQDIVPEYLPGVPSYGQEGAEGNIGETGPSIHYSSYNIEEDLETCEKLLNKGKSLSNNLDEVESPEYMENDYILDSIGTFWRVKSEKNGEAFYLENANIANSPGGNAFLDFQASCVTSYIRNSRMTNKTDNELYKSDYDDTSSSPKVYHRQIYEKYTYGNWILFKVILNEGFEASDFLYKYVLLLPNGEQLSMTSDDPHAIMYVDNNLFYSFSLDYDYSVSNYINHKPLTHMEMKKNCVASGDYTYKIVDYEADLTSTPQYALPAGMPSNLKQMIAFDGINRTYIEDEETVTEKRNNESDAFVAITISRFITDFCSAYVEAYHKETGKTYRMDLDEIYLQSSINEAGETNYNEYNSHIDIITPVVPLTEWAVHTYTQGFLLDDTADSSVSARFRRMDSFMLFGGSSHNPNDTSTYETKDFYYIDLTGLQKDYIHLDDENPSSTPSYYPNSYGHKSPTNANSFIDPTSSNYIGDCPRTIRLKFMNAESLSVTIDYNPIDLTDNSGNHIVTHPFTMIYIGVPDCDLISYGNNIKVSEEGYVDKGIYYLHRFIPSMEGINYGNVFSKIGLTDENAELINVGKAIFNINLSEFKLNPNKMHFIEIGAVAIGSWDINNDTLEDDLNYWNILHRAVDENGYVYNFRDDSRTNAGESDITMYVNKVSGLSETNNFVESESDEYYAFTKGTLDTIIDPTTGKSSLRTEFEEDEN